MFHLYCPTPNRPRLPFRPAVTEFFVNMVTLPAVVVVYPLVQVGGMVGIGIVPIQ